MKSLTTSIKITPKKGLLDHRKKGLAIGSCFVSNIGGWLQQHKFDLKVNPFGIVYNPMSIASQLEALLVQNSNSSNSPKLVTHNELWHSFQHHSSFSGFDKEEVSQKIQTHFKAAQQQLRKADYLILTLGTSNVYTHIESNEIVANCHKFPNNIFSKRRLSIEEVTTAFVPIFEKLQTTLPNLKIILTVSPIRHLKDGSIENQRSKSVLLLATDILEKQFEHVSYFPAYEIMMDDLRDYRFYEKDMLHPNELAIDYIKELFSQTYFDDQTMQLQKEILAIQQAVAHRPFHPASKGHQDFLKVQLRKIGKMEKRYSFLDWKEEKSVLEKQILIK